MIDIGLDTAGRVIVIKLTGFISEADIDRCNEKFAVTFDRETLHRVLLDWQGLEGWEKGAKAASTWAGMRHWATIRRLAVIADEEWGEETLRIADIYRAAEVERFRRNAAMRRWPG